MKNFSIVLLLFGILLGCTNPHKVQQIELLSYFTNARDFHIYVVVEPDGSTEVLYKSKTSDSIDHYTLKIRFL